MFCRIAGATRFYIYEATTLMNRPSLFTRQRRFLKLAWEQRTVDDGWTKSFMGFDALGALAEQPVCRINARSMWWHCWRHIRLVAGILATVVALHRISATVGSVKPAAVAHLDLMDGRILPAVYHRPGHGRIGQLPQTFIKDVHLMVADRGRRRSLRERARTASRFGLKAIFITIIR